ncbi:hypothetical protein IE322_05660 [Pseudomonas asiatica]|uniref:hypothetical protein n=1 Tax=Pseudomonas asiatica TaxID=2219225 RepID=UPI00174EA835|nr:hypothetical protein [Pseudomonas asiatica]QOE09548.1 hypothetical protein IE322_05660 [Pseudomonas asiatica]
MIMKKIRALRQFSHYHAGNFDQHETRAVLDEYAEALIGIGLAEEVLDPEPLSEPEQKAGKKK